MGLKSSHADEGFNNSHHQNDPSGFHRPKKYKQRLSTEWEESGDQTGSVFNGLLREVILGSLPNVAAAPSSDLRRETTRRMARDLPRSGEPGGSPSIPDDGLNG